MPKIQFKRKKSTGIGTNKLSAGEPLYNLQDKTLYIGGDASADETPSKHLTEVEVSNGGKVSIGGAVNNDFAIEGYNGIQIFSDPSRRAIKLAINEAFVPNEANSAKQLTQSRKIALDGAVTGYTEFNGSADRTISTMYSINDSKANNKVVRCISTDATGKLTTVKGSLVPGNNVSIDEVGNNLTISSDVDFETLSAESNEIAFSINGKEYRKSIALEGVGMSVDSAKKWTTGRTLTLSGGASGSVSIDGSKDVTLAVTIEKTATHKHGNITNNGLLGSPSKVVITDNNNTITTSSITSTELSYLAGTTSKIQDQLNGKADTSHGTHVTYGTSLPTANGTASMGTATSVSRSDHVHPTDTSRAPSSHSHGNIDKDGKMSQINKAVVTDGNGRINVSIATSTEVGYLSGVTSSIQTQLNGKASSTHKHKLSTTITSGESSATVSCVDLSVKDGVLEVSRVIAAKNGHTHSVTLTDAETGTPV